MHIVMQLQQAEEGATAIENEEVLDDAPKKKEANATSDMKTKKKTKKAYTSYDECGFCGSIHSVLFKYNNRQEGYFPK